MTTFAFEFERHSRRVWPALRSHRSDDYRINEPIHFIRRDHEARPRLLNLASDRGIKLDKVNLKEGQEVKAGDVLFEIDPRPFQAELARADANVTQAVAHRERLDADYRRASGHFAREP